MAERLSLSRLERDIVVQLEEAGSEVVTVVLNSLSDTGQWYPRRRHVLAAAGAAVVRLTGLNVVGLVQTNAKGFPAIEVTDQLLDLQRWLVWEANGGYWRSLESREIGLALLRSTLQAFRGKRRDPDARYRRIAAHGFRPEWGLVLGVVRSASNRRGDDSRLGRGRCHRVSARGGPPLLFRRGGL